MHQVHSVVVQPLACWLLMLGSTSSACARTLPTQRERLRPVPHACLALPAVRDRVALPRVGGALRAQGLPQHVRAGVAGYQRRVLLLPLQHHLPPGAHFLRPCDAKCWRGPFATPTSTSDTRHITGVALLDWRFLSPAVHHVLQRMQLSVFNLVCWFTYQQNQVTLFQQQAYPHSAFQSEFAARRS